MASLHNIPECMKVPQENSPNKLDSKPYLLRLTRETLYPPGTAQNEQNNKPRTTHLVPGDQIKDIVWMCCSNE